MPSVFDNWNNDREVYRHARHVATPYIDPRAVHKNVSLLQ